LHSQKLETKGVEQRQSLVDVKNMDWCCAAHVKTVSRMVVVRLVARDVLGRCLSIVAHPNAKIIIRRSFKVQLVQLDKKLPAAAPTPKIPPSIPNSLHVVY
jgi:hypothetical protein